MTSAFYLIKYNLVKQVRSHVFLMIVVISILLGFLCVPGANDGYEIFYLGGVRGIYNSAWLGAMAAALPVILLWLPGFYLLRSQISEDRRMKIGQVIAATPTSKLRYIGGKFLSNLSVLAALDLLFTAAIIVMQLIRHESLHIALWQYIQPFLLLTVPYLCVLAALTVLFDTVPGLGGVMGNILIFIVWIALSSMSVAMPGNLFDLFGIGFILAAMMQGAKAYYPGLPDGGSFGYYKTNGVVSTFVWDGMAFEQGFLQSRLAWIGISLIIVLFSALIFDRFREKQKAGKTVKTKKAEAGKHNPNINGAFSLSPVKKSNGVNLLSLIKGELKLMLLGLPAWWYIFSATAMVLSFFVVMNEGLKWISFIMLLPMAIWSQMGCRDKFHSTDDLMASCCPAKYKWLATWVSGVLVSVLVSSGIIIHFVLAGESGYAAAWTTGAVFIPTMALALGSTAGNRKLFEAVYIALFYFGPINNMWKFDFLGVQTNNTFLYAAITGILLALGITVQILKDKRMVTFKMR